MSHGEIEQNCYQKQNESSNLLLVKPKREWLVHREDISFLLLSSLFSKTFFAPGRVEEAYCISVMSHY